MQVLLVKTSSLGDVIHLLPAVTDLHKAHPKAAIDWLVEEAFADIPALHPAVRRVVPVAFRRWRRQPFQAWRSGEWQSWRRQLRSCGYDAVVDAQGLLKSAWLARQARGLHSGPDWRSAREAPASLFYGQRLDIPNNQHAIQRNRQLLAKALGYPEVNSAPDYGLAPAPCGPTSDSILLLHGTTRQDKEWPESHWQELIQGLKLRGWSSALPWGTVPEQARAERLACTDDSVEVLPRQSLALLAQRLRGARAAIAVDTGLGHLAAALGTPCVSLYGPTDPARVGTWGRHQQHLQGNTMRDIRADSVLAALEQLLRTHRDTDALRLHHP